MAKSWRNTSDYRNWRKAVLERDGHKCVITGATTKLHAHHLNHSTYFPDERFDVENGVTVTSVFHLIFHIIFMRGYRKKCTVKDWERMVRFIKYFKIASKLFK